MSEGPDERSPAKDRTERLEAQLAAVTARVFQLEREVAILRGTPPPIATTGPMAGRCCAGSRYPIGGKRRLCP